MRYKLFPFTLAVALALGLPYAAVAQDNPPSQDQPQQGRGPGRMEREAHGEVLEDAARPALFDRHT